ncbi:hypothetical protein P280DRAFT_428945 [Massarina eburnea CBS 473.64]|uniref:EthD domain-containing protein n=1 Tax=Massarina eburnea CBS 473.64 TaxID=1395130 RepID=A0A6A6RZ04_9PLEO|nr:hypothetical protein P280DRAFT_428945 [Massarina eburnea CBS 473.64]
MTFIVLIYQTRKEGLTPQEFRDGMENISIPWMDGFTKLHKPVSFTRHYPVRLSSELGQRFAAVSAIPQDPNNDAPVVLIGETKDIDWDVMIKAVYRDELHLQQYLAWVNEPDHAEQIAKCEEAYADPTRLKVVVIGEADD